MFENGQKMDILRNIITNMELATGFSTNEYLKGEGLDDYDINCFHDENLYCIPLAIQVIEEFENNSDQSAKAFLEGEGYSKEEIEYLLSETEKSS